MKYIEYISNQWHDAVIHYFPKNPCARTIVILCIINFIIRLPFMALLPFSDQNVYYDGVLKIFNNNLNPFTNFMGYKPPFMFELTAILFTLFRPSITIGSLLVYAASSTSLVYTYMLGSSLFGKKAGIYASLFLFFFPLFAAQSFQFTDAIFVTPLLLATFYYYYKRGFLGYLIAATLAVLTRETSLFVPLFLGLFELFHKPQEIIRLPANVRLSKSLILWLPLFPFTIWMYLNKFIFGWYIEPTNVSFFSFTDTIWSRIIMNLQTTFLHNGSYIFVVIIVLWIFITINNKVRLSSRQRHATIIFSFFFLIYFLFYSTGPFHPRYMLSLYPYLCILAGGAIAMIWKSTLSSICFYGICTLLIVMQLIQFFVLPMRYWGEADLSIIQTAVLYSRSIKNIQQQYPNSLIVVKPVIYSGNDSSLGYTENSIKKKLYFWNDWLDESLEYTHMVKYAKIRSLSPIIFVIASPEVIPSILERKMDVIEKVRSPFGNSANYHTLYMRETKDIDL